jgi:hypothetical protein
MMLKDTLTTPLSRLFQRMLRLLLVGLIAIGVAACGGEVQEGYEDDDTGSPSQGAPLDGGDIEVDEYNEEEGENGSEDE